MKTKITTKPIILVVKDPHGNTDWGVVCEWYETVQICGMKNEAGEDLYFESDAYHLRSWADDNGLEFVDKEIETKIKI